MDSIERSLALTAEYQLLFGKDYHVRVSVRSAGFGYVLSVKHVGGWWYTSREIQDVAGEPEFIVGPVTNNLHEKDSSMTYSPPEAIDRYLAYQQAAKRG